MIVPKHKKSESRAIDPRELVRAAAVEQQGASHVVTPSLAASYKLLASHLCEQLREVKAVCFVEQFAGDGEPYQRDGRASSAEMRDRVECTRELYYMETDASRLPLGHPMSMPADCQDSTGRELILNDVFRIVHDYIAHINGGWSFSTRGEYNAMLAHATTLPDDAYAALWCETFGQTAVYDASGDFADQKCYETSFVPVINYTLSNWS